ncbi:MAG: hypothetical protein ACR2MO_16175 [Acidimicrobiales bacterium]
MDVLTLLRLFGRHKIVVAIASLLTFAAVTGTYMAAPPLYRASGSVVLLNPPPLPEAAPDAPPRGPGFQNPIKDLDDMSVVVDILARVMSTSEVEDKLVTAGLTGTYTIGANIDFYRGPIIDVAAEATSGPDAIDTAKRVMTEVGVQLAKLQTDQGTDPSYQIRTSTVVPPERATKVFSSALRRLIGAGALGVIAIIGAALTAEAITVARSRRRARPSYEGDEDIDEDDYAEALPLAIEAPPDTLTRPRALRAGPAVEAAPSVAEPESLARDQRNLEELMAEARRLEERRAEERRAEERRAEERRADERRADERRADERRHAELKAEERKAEERRDEERRAEERRLEALKAEERRLEARKFEEPRPTLRQYRPEVVPEIEEEDDDAGAPVEPRPIAAVHPYVQAVRALRESEDPMAEEQFPSRRTS